MFRHLLVKHLLTAQLVNFVTNLMQSLLDKLLGDLLENLLENVLRNLFGNYFGDWLQSVPKKLLGNLEFFPEYVREFALGFP